MIPAGTKKIFSSEVYDFDYTCVFNKELNLVYEQINSATITKKLISREAVLHLNKSRYSHYFQNIDGKVVEVSGASVHHYSDPGHNMTEPEGYLFIVREYDKKFISEMEKICASKIYVSSTD